MARIPIVGSGQFTNINSNFIELYPLDTQTFVPGTGINISKQSGVYYSQYTQSGALSVSIASQAIGGYCELPIVTDGSNISISGIEIRNDYLNDIALYKLIVKYSAIGVEYSIIKLDVDVIPPQLVSAIVYNSTPGQITLVFDEIVTATNVGYSVLVNSVSITITSITGSGTTTLQLVLASNVANGNTVTFSYDPATGNTLDLGNNELQTLTNHSVTNNVLNDQILLSDTFTGTTIDAAKWTALGYTGNIAVTQNDKLLMTQLGGSAASSWVDSGPIVKSVTTFTNGYFKFDLIRTANYGADLSGMGFYLSNGSRACIISASTDNNVRLFIFISGTGTVYDATVACAGGLNNSFKIAYASDNTIKYYYWTGSAWVQLGATQTQNIGTNKMVAFTQATNVAHSQNLQIDNVYVCASDFATLNP
jgi:hypothetical protein